MASGQNLLAGKKGRAAPELICGQTRILARYLIVQPHHVVNGRSTQFSSDRTLGTAYVRVNQHGTVHLNNRLDYKFGDAVFMSRTRSTKSGVLILFN